MSDFFDRHVCLELLTKRMSGFKEGYRQNIAIIGDEFIGKTTLVCAFLNKYYDPRIITIYLENRPETLESFARRFIGVLFYSFLRNSDMELKEHVEFLLDKSSRYVPATTEKARMILVALRKRKKHAIFTDLLKLCDSIHHETGKLCAVVFDEFHNLESLSTATVFAEWSKLLVVQKSTMYIITSSRRAKAKTILSKHLSLLFGNFEIVGLEPFDAKTSEQYLTQRLEGIALDANWRNFLIHFTGGHPFYLKTLADILQKAGDPDLVDMLENLLFEPSGLLHQRFSNYLKKFIDIPSSQEYLAILYHIASGHNTLKSIAHALGKAQKELSKKVLYLLESDCISRTGDFLTVNDRVFNFWLQFVYKEKLQSLTFDAKNQKEFFRKHLGTMISEFSLSSQKPMIERMIELLRAFENEVIPLERKKIRLDHFQEIKPVSLNNKNLKNGLIGRSLESVWIVAIKPEPITEDDIVEFSKECRKFRNKLQRKVIITLQDTDANARLKAMEEKVWTWDIANLNRLLDFYSQPRIIANNTAVLP